MIRKIQKMTISKFVTNREKIITATSRNFKTNLSSLRTYYKVYEATTTGDSEWR
jgi:hypothetical protein